MKGRTIEYILKLEIVFLYSLKYIKDIARIVLLLWVEESKLRIAILDNNKYFCDKIKRLIIDNSQVSAFDIDVYVDPQKFLANKMRYDLLFLEIDIQEVDGINLAKQLKRDRIIIIFVTKVSNRMAEALGINVAGYITKDQIDTEFKKIFSETLEYVNHDRIITIIKKDAIYCYSPHEIFYLEYVDRRLYVYKDNGCDDLGYISIKEIIKILPVQFVLVNKNQIVNINRIATMHGLIIKLKNRDVKIEISRRKKKEVFESIVKAINHMK